MRKSIRDKADYAVLDRKESLKDDSLIYLSSKGEEMWKMFAQDSVLLELFREEVYRDCNKVDFNMQCSFDLIETGNQKEIFLDLLKYIEYLGDKEDDLRNRITEEIKKNKYRELFGDSMIVLHLLEGVQCSLWYSGKGDDPDIKNYLFQLRNKLGT